MNQFVDVPIRPARRSRMRSRQECKAVVILFILFAPRALAQDVSLPELTLDQAVQQALDRNASYQSAKLDSARSEKDLAANKTKRYPSLQANVIGGQLLTRPSTTFAAGALGNFAATGPIPATDQAITIPRRLAVFVYASASQPLTSLYRIHLSLKGLSFNLEGTREDERKARLNTVDEVRRAYYDVVKAQSQVNSASASLPLYRESARLAKENRRQEMILQSELLQSATQLIRTENSLKDAADQLAEASEKLNDLMGRDVHTPFRVSAISTVDQDAQPQETLEANALVNRPDVKKARLQIQAAGYDRRAKKAEYIPDLSLSVNYITTANLGSTLPSNIASAGMTLSWEPWDWGRKRHEYAGKQIQEEQAKVALRATERGAQIEVRSAWRQLESARRQLLLLESTQRAARQKLLETQEKTRREAALSKDLFSAQSDLASADSQHQQALAAFWSARADLKKATGEE